MPNIYRPRDKYVAELDEFITEFSSFLTLLQHRTETSFTCGDFNVNLLEISTNAHFNNYLSLLFLKVFFPGLLHEIRIQPSSFSLIDNILCNNIGGAVDSTSGLRINDILEHNIIFYKFSQ